jgi:hypothetical protein
MLCGTTPMSMLTGIRAGEHGTQQAWVNSKVVDSDAREPPCDE